jgi:hypothetical protein
MKASNWKNSIIKNASERCSMSVEAQAKAGSTQTAFKFIRFGNAMSINQSIDQSTNHSIHQSINQSKA